AQHLVLLSAGSDPCNNLVMSLPNGVFHEFVSKAALPAQIGNLAIADSATVKGGDLVGSAAAAGEPTSQLREEIASRKTGACHDEGQHADNRHAGKKNRLAMAE